MKKTTKGRGKGAGRATRTASKKPAAKKPAAKPSSKKPAARKPAAEPASKKAAAKPAAAARSAAKKPAGKPTSKPEAAAKPTRGRAAAKPTLGKAKAKPTRGKAAAKPTLGKAAAKPTRGRAAAQPTTIRAAARGSMAGPRADFGQPIDAFFARQPAALRSILDELRALVEEEVPDAESSLKWGMPFYALEGAMMCAFAGHKAHVNLILSGPPSAYADPDRLLEGAAATGRHLKLRPGAAIPREEVRRWIATAAQLARAKRT